MAQLGFIGLGNMGHHMASNVLTGGHSLICYDIAGTESRAPDGSEIAESIREIVAKTELIILCVSDAKAVGTVIDEIVWAKKSKVTTVVDTSTIGSMAARSAMAKLSIVGINYIDSPVAGASGGSGIGPKAAKEAALTFIVAGPNQIVEKVKPVLQQMGSNIFHIGEEPGQAQAIKLINNFLIGTAMVAVAEGISYGLNQNLDMKSILDVVNVSSGQNIATSNIFPNAIQNNLYNMGAPVEILNKDIGAYYEEVKAQDLPNSIGALVSNIWKDMENELPGADFSRVYQFINTRK